MNGRRFARRLASLARGVGWGRNALRRRVDRIEGATTVAAVVLALAAIPMATMVGTAVYHHDLKVSAEQTATSHQTTATLREPAPMLDGRRGPATTVAARAWWITPSGSRHIGEVRTTGGAQAGSVVRIWTDAVGTQVDPPMSPRQAWAQGGLATMFTLTSALAALAVIVIVIRWRLNRRRYAALDAEWRRVAPRWTQRA